MRDKKERRNIYMRDSIHQKAMAIMKARDMDNFSEFLSQLIREEHERRIVQSPAIIKHTAKGRS